jgi:tRNA(Ile2) C34 agmatinyltransferase TiaS
MMPVDGSRYEPRGGKALGLRHRVVHAFRSIRTRVLAWRATHQREALPDDVLIGTLRRPNLAITMRATVVPTETTPPPIHVFLKRMVSHPLSPYCPRCSLPLEPWQADPQAEGRPSGYECRPCGTHIRWTPADVLNQMQREVRRHYAQYWEQYRDTIRQHERGAPHTGVGGHHWRGDVR